MKFFDNRELKSENEKLRMEWIMEKCKFDAVNYPTTSGKFGGISRVQLLSFGF
jgi:hypothetical protein